MRAPERIETPRLILRKPTSADAQAVYSRYASDPEVTKFLIWPTHCSLDDTRSWLALSEAQWQSSSTGAYLIESRHDSRLLGGTGLILDASEAAAETGYVLARDAWGLGYATEALTAMVALAHDLGLHRLFAECHPGHEASVRVLEKCGFRREALLEGHAVFPNLNPGQPADCLRYSYFFSGRANT